MKDEEYETLRRGFDAKASLDEIHAEANVWNSCKVRPGTFRRCPQEDFYPGDTCIKTLEEALD